jgi:S-adenosylmethionine decarboxylase
VKYKPEGSHVIVELSGGDYTQLNDLKLLKEVIMGMVEATDSKMIKMVHHSFKPQGISIVALVEESHISIHTYPEWGYAAIDVFTCGENSKSLAALTVIEQKLRHQYLEINKLWRGLSK